MIMPLKDREGWLNFKFLGDGRVQDEKERDVGNHHEKLGLKRISGESQLYHPRYGREETRSTGYWHYYEVFHTQSGSLTPDFTYPLVSSISFPSSSPISLSLVHNSTIIAQYKVESSLSMFPSHDHELILNTVYTKYSIHPRFSVFHHSHEITSWPLNVASASQMPPYKNDRHQPALHEGSQVKSPHHIPTVAHYPTVE